MIASHALVVLGGLIVMLPVALTELPSGFSLQSLVRRDATPRSATENDHRRIVDARRSPYSAIGKFKGTMTCTAAIGLTPRIIITAGGCSTRTGATTKRSKLSCPR